MTEPRVCYWCKMWLTCDEDIERGIHEQCAIEEEELADADEDLGNYFL